MKKLMLPLLSGLALASVGLSAQTVVWSEGFNSDFSTPYSSGFGIQFGLSLPGIVTSPNNGLSATEGDSFAGANISSTVVTPTIVSGQTVSLGTVAEANVTYTFTGDFGWRFGTLASAQDLAFNTAQTGFLVDGMPSKNDGLQLINFGNDFSRDAFEEVSFSYTTVSGDIGKSLGVQIRLQDNGAIDGLTQLVTDNWQVTVIPEPSTFALFGGCLALSSVLFIRHRQF